MTARLADCTCSFGEWADFDHPPEYRTDEHCPLHGRAIDASPAMSEREGRLVKAARQLSESADGIYIEISDQEAEHLRETFGELDNALAAYQHPDMQEKP